MGLPPPYEVRGSRLPMLSVAVLVIIFDRFILARRSVCLLVSSGAEQTHRKDGSFCNRKAHSPKNLRGLSLQLAKTLSWITIFFPFISLPPGLMSYAEYFLLTFRYSSLLVISDIERQPGKGVLSRVQTPDQDEFTEWLYFPETRMSYLRGFLAHSPG